jgi:hypothetical protein
MPEREIRDVRAVLAIRVDDEPLVTGCLDAFAQARKARGAQRARQYRHRIGHPEVGQLDLREIRLQRAVQPQSIT